MFEEIFWLFFGCQSHAGQQSGFYNGTLQTHFPYNRQVDEKQMI
jgi:hypothetical protein